MLILSVHFPARRYHASPWDRHVNEGEVEWPPAPWRFLRALLAAGFAVEHWPDEAVPPLARSLVEKLAADVPSFRLPAAASAHTRHYMPIRSGRSETTTLVLDAFLRFVDPDPELLIEWPEVQLEPAELELLDRLLPAISYLGRAESWAECRRVESADESGIWCRPLAHDREPAGEVVPTLCAVAHADYAATRTAGVQQSLAVATAESGGKLSTARRRKLEAEWPADVVDALLQRTSSLRGQGWTRPPASRLVRYDLPAPALRPGLGRGPAPRAARETVDTLLWALSSDTVRGQVLPSLTRALPQAELLHRSAVSRLGASGNCAALTGLDDVGEPLRGNRHTHYVPLDLDGDGRLDHVLVHAPMGFDQRALDALRGVSRTWAKGVGHDLVVSCAGVGRLPELVASLVRDGHRAPAVLATSATWASVTPFVLPRHPKRTRHHLEDQVRAELAARGFPEPAAIELFDRAELLDRGLHRFVRRRRPGRPQPPLDRAFGLRLRFAEQVRGILAIGYASHFGLGLFAAE